MKFKEDVYYEEIPKDEEAETINYKGVEQLEREGYVYSIMFNKWYRPKKEQKP